MKIITRISITVFHNDNYSSAEGVRQSTYQALVDLVKKPSEWTLENEITHSGMTITTFRKQDDLI